MGVRGINLVDGSEAAEGWMITSIFSAFWSLIFMEFKERQDVQCAFGVPSDSLGTENLPLLFTVC